MIQLENGNEVYSKRSVPLWLISAFKAGFLNSMGFLITGKFVSHVTGFGTQVGVAIGHEDYFFSLELLIIPLAFILGGVTTSWILDGKDERKVHPPFWKVQFLITLTLLGVILMGENLFTSSTQFPFDADNIYTGLELLLIGMLCFVCGLKNSLVTWSTFGKIRVTHLTGLSTDIGLNLLRTFNPSWRSSRFQEARYVNIIRIMTFVCFSTGALISAMLYPNFGFKTLIIPVLILVCMTGVSILDASKENKVRI